MYSTYLLIYACLQIKENICKQPVCVCSLVFSIPLPSRTVAHFSTFDLALSPTTCESDRGTPHIRQQKSDEMKPKQKQKTKRTPGLIKPPGPPTPPSPPGLARSPLRPVPPTPSSPWATGVSTSRDSTTGDSTAPLVLLSLCGGGGGFHSLGPSLVDTGIRPRLVGPSAVGALGCLMWALVSSPHTPSLDGTAVVGREVVLRAKGAPGGGCGQAVRGDSYAPTHCIAHKMRLAARPPRRRRPRNGRHPRSRTPLLQRRP